MVSIFSRALAAFALLGLGSCAVEPARAETSQVSLSTELRATFNELKGDAYELDALDRHSIDGDAGVVCSPEGLVDYRGSTVRYTSPVKIHPAFQPRLERFEQIVVEVATDVYGRAPSRIRHFGAFSCRRARNRERLSEHALGNAIDVAGFDFAAAAKDQPLTADAPASLKRGFQVSVAKHWSASQGDAAKLHSRFLQALAQRVVAEPELFRTAIGPARPDHHDHLHFDMAPWRYTFL